MLRRWLELPDQPSSLARVAWTLDVITTMIGKPSRAITTLMDVPRAC